MNEAEPMIPAIRPALIACAASLMALPVAAQTPPTPVDAAAQAPGPADAQAPHAVPHAEAPVAKPATANDAFAAAMDKMHKAMMIAPTGNADVDFVRGMIPHHQGAVDMARIELEFGNDPELRRLSETIIKDQQAEIARMQAWLERHAPDAANADAAKTQSLTANPATGAPPAQKPAN